MAWFLTACSPATLAWVAATLFGVFACDAKAVIPPVGWWRLCIGGKLFVTPDLAAAASCVPSSTLMRCGAGPPVTGALDGMACKHIGGWSFCVSSAFFVTGSGVLRPGCLFSFTSSCVLTAGCSFSPLGFAGCRFLRPDRWLFTSFLSSFSGAAMLCGTLAEATLDSRTPRTSWM